MPWYYSEQREQRGPFDDTEMLHLARDGVLHPDTRVWREGLANWIPWGEAHAGLRPVKLGAVAEIEAITPEACAPATQPAPPPKTAPATDCGDPSRIAGLREPWEASGTWPVGQAGICVACARPVGPGDSVRIGGKLVCAACRSGYLQKIREGTPPPCGLPFANFWTRLTAKLVDAILLAIPCTLLSLIAKGILALRHTPPDTPEPITHALGIAVALLGFLICAAYSIVTVVRFQATPGKILCRLKIVRSDGTPPDTPVATGRFLAELLSLLSLGAGYLLSERDPKKRALHDRLSDTHVIRTP